MSKRILANQEKLVLHLYANRIYIRDIALKVGLSIPAIYKILNNHKIPPRGYKALSKETEEEICLRYQLGESSKDIALEMGVVSGTIVNILKRHNYKRRDKNANLRRSTAGKWINDAGYVFIYCKNHPNADCKGYVREHRLVMEKHIGRLLTSDEVVHHIDNSPSNNKIENLMLFPNNAAHKRYHKLMDNKK
jgi:hypothetical protein